MYVKKFTSLCEALKRCTQKKTGSFFLPHGVYTTPYCWIVQLLGLLITYFLLIVQLSSSSSLPAITSNSTASP